MMRSRAFSVLALGLLASCQDAPPATQGVAAALAGPPVRISELHYDNVGADVGEQIEISGPAGTDLTGYSVVLYNGSGGANYGTTELSGTLPATCGARGVVVVPAAGMQNGAPDGVALVGPGGVVIEFLSYEGVFTATAGAANGLTSVDIGVLENGSGPVGESLARNAEGGWNASAPATFGACNDDGDTTPPAEVATVTVSPATSNLVVGATQAFTATALDADGEPVAGVTLTWTSNAETVATVNANGLATAVAPGTATVTATAPNGIAGSAAVTVTEAPTPTFPDIRFTEIHYDNSGVDSGEAIEIEGPAGTDLTGWSVVLYDGTPDTVTGLRDAYSTTVLSGAIPATCDDRGVLVVEYPSNGIQNGSPDGLALVDASGNLVEFLSYEGSFTADGGPADAQTSVDIGVSEASSASVSQSLQRDGFNVWALVDQSFGVCNEDGPPPAGNTLQFSGRVPTDPALPVGYQDQIFATLKAPGNVTIPTTIVWAAETPAIATIDELGVITALAPGNATFRATAAEGTTATYTLPTAIATQGTTADYAGNTEFGEPADGDASDDVIVRHVEFTSSWNPSRGTPNWVSYNLEASHFGEQDRCDCFVFDPALPASFPRYTTADYTGAGAFHGYGIDRGHLARSFDRTTGSLDNAHTYLFTNIVPQASDLNQGPWAAFEADIGDRARFQDKEVYIVTGVTGNKGTIKDEGKIVIPTRTWKVVVIMPRNQGLDDVVDASSLEVIAVDMPNEAGVRNTPWQTYLSTVDQIEAQTGYNLLALLPDAIEAAVEGNGVTPIAAVDGPYATQEGGSISVSAAGSSDRDGSVVSYAWDFGDGSTATGATATHQYAQDGVYVVRLTVTDNDGLTSSATTEAVVANVVPVVGAVGPATLIAGETFVVTTGFTDPGADAFSATVDWGDGSPSTVATVGDHSLAASHRYTSTGVFTVTVTVSDDDGAGVSTTTVTVQSAAQAIGSAIALVDGLVAAGKLHPLLGRVLVLELRLAQRLSPPAADALLGAVLVEVDALVRLGALSAADAAPLRSLLARLTAAL
jgi:DNA/RNA endonuclease G (NUC1)/PKD repeat protein